MALLQKMSCSLVGHDFEEYDIAFPVQKIQKLVCIRCGQIFARHTDFGIMPYDKAKRKFRSKYQFD